MSELKETWNDFICDGRGCYLVNDPETTFQDAEEAAAYCDEHNRALAGQAAQAERARIIGVIEYRLQIHRGFIMGALDAGVKPSPSIFHAMVELRDLLRELRQ